MTPDKPITVAITVLGVVLGLMLPRRYAILPVGLSLALYPSNLLLPPDGLGLTAQRVIAAVVLLRCLISREIRTAFKWEIYDTVALVYFVLLFVSQLITQGIDQALINRGGFFLSALVPFWCVRMLVVDRQTFYIFIKGFIWAALPLAILGVIFMTRGYSPYYAIMQHGSFFTDTVRPQSMREFMGQMYYRAHAPFIQCIMFGWFFAVWVVPATNLYFEKRSVWPWIIPWLFLPIGAISSVASGPMMVAALSFFLLTFFPLRRFLPALTWTAIFLYVAVLVLANRSPMHLIASFGMDPASSYYRVGLTDVVLKWGGMSGHWIAGYGEIPGGFYGFRDLCIHWIMLVVFNGLMGLLGFYALVFISLVGVLRALRRATTLEGQWMAWGFLCVLVATNAAMFIVSLFTEMYFIYHMLLALFCSAPRLIGGSERQVGVLAEYQGKPVLLRYTLKPGQRLAVVHPPAKPE